MKHVLLLVTVACAAAVAFCDGGEASDARVSDAKGAGVCAQPCYRITAIGVLSVHMRKRVEVAQARAEFDRMSEEGVFSNLEWSVAVNRLEKLRSRFTTPEGYLSAEEQISRVKMMKTAHDVLISKVAGVVCGGLKVVGANEVCIRCVRGDRIGADVVSIPWTRFALDYTKSFDDAVERCIVTGRSSMRLTFREWIWAMMGVATLYRELFPLSDWAKARSEQILTTLRDEFPDADCCFKGVIRLERFVDADGVLTREYALRQGVVEAGCVSNNKTLLKQRYQAVVEIAGGDIGKVEHAILEFARTNEVEIASCMIDVLAECGSERARSELYSLAANTNLCCEALSAILRLEGVSSNSLSATASVLSNLRVRELDRLDLCVALVDNAYSLRTSTAQRDMALSFLLAHFRTCPYPQGIDEALVRKDAGYRHSRRRLANLRAVYAHGVDQWDIAYVTNAINELVAYPEQNLPE